MRCDDIPNVLTPRVPDHYLFSIIDLCSTKGSSSLGLRFPVIFFSSPILHITACMLLSSRPRAVPVFSLVILVHHKSVYNLGEATFTLSHDYFIVQKKGSVFCLLQWAFVCRY